MVSHINFQLFYHKCGKEKKSGIPWLSDNLISSGLSVRKTKVLSYKVGGKSWIVTCFHRFISVKGGETWARKFTVFVRFTFSSNTSNHVHIWYVTWTQKKTSKNSDWGDRFWNMTILFAKTRHYLQLVVWVWGNVQYFENYRSLRGFKI